MMFGHRFGSYGIILWNCTRRLRLDRFGNSSYSLCGRNRGFASYNAAAKSSGKLKAKWLIGTGLAGFAAVSFSNVEHAHDLDWLMDYKRAMKAGLVFVRLTATYKLMKLRIKYQCDSKEQEDQIRRLTHERGSDLVLQLCRSNGGIFIKFAQHAGSLKGAIPNEYIDKLRVLQDKAPTKSEEEVLQVIDEEIGLDTFWEKVQDLGPVVGSASLAQVHRSTLRNGMEVALKIQHKHLNRIVQSDVRLIKWLDHIASNLFSDDGFSLAWAVEEFESNLHAELNFSREAENARRCKALFEQCHESPNVIVPEILDDLCSDRMISMEFIRGVPVNDVDTITNKWHLDTETVAKTIVNAFAFMFFVSGFVHCDPHYGNLMVCRDGRVALLDHGLYRQLSQTFRVNNCLLWEAMILQDERGLATACTNMGMPRDIWQLMPFIFVNRAVDAKGELGKPVPLTDAQKEQLRAKLGISRLTYSDLGSLADKLPEDMIFVLKTMHLVKDLNDILGGNNRDRFMTYASYAVQGSLYDDKLEFNYLWFPFHYLKFYTTFILHEWSWPWSQSPTHQTGDQPTFTLSRIVAGTT